MASDACNVLLVEDEFLIALDVQMQLEGKGYKVRGPAATVDDALAILEQDPVCAAILDVNIRDSTSLPIAERLTVRGIPCIFLSGNDMRQVREQFGDCVILAKPLEYRRLFAELAAICNR